MKGNGENTILRNIFSNNYHAFSHQYVLHKKLCNHQNIVIFGMDDAAEGIFCACLQFGLNVTGFCDAFRTPFGIWFRQLDYIPILEPEQAASLPDCAMLMSKETYQKLVTDKAFDVCNANIYIATIDFYDEVFKLDGVYPMYQLNAKLWEKPLVIYGCGGEGVKLARGLQKQGLDFDCFCDRNPDKQSGLLLNKNIISLDDLFSRKGKVHVVIAIRAWENIFLNFRDSGFDESDLFVNIVCFENITKSIASIGFEGNVRRFQFGNIIYYYTHGKTIYERLLADSNTQYIFTLPDSFGDICLMCSCGYAFKQQRKIDKLAAVVPERLQFIPEGFTSIDAAVSAQPSDIFSLANYIIMSGRYDENNVTCAYFRPKRLMMDVWDHPADYDKDLFNEYKKILCIPDDMLPEKIEIPYQTLKQAAASPLGKKANGAVLLIPDGTHIFHDIRSYDKNIFRDLFSKIAERLNAEGMSVYTNAASEGDLPIQGTEVLATNVRELLAVSGRFRAVISMLTGLGELLTLANCNLSMVFLSDHSFNRNAFDIFAQGTRAASYLWKREESEQLINQIADKILASEPI